MKYDIFRFERELVLNAALKIISEGQIKHIGLTEISHFSGLAEGTVRKIFQSTEVILNELSRHITESIRTNTISASYSGSDFREQFNLVWQSMFEYYRQNPQVIAFMQSPKNMNIPEIEIITGLLDFFKGNEDSFTGKIHPELLTLLFHGSIITAAKISLQNDPDDYIEKIRFMPDILWSGLIEQEILDGSRDSLNANLPGSIKDMGS